MRTRTTLGLALVAAFFAAALAVAGTAHAAEKKVFAFDRKYIPYSFVRNQQPTGFEVEVMEAVLNGSGLGIEYKPLRDWDRGQAELASGVVHVAAGVVRTDLKEKLFIFPDTPTLTLDLKFFVNRASQYANVGQLRGQLIAARRDSVTQLLLQEFGGVKVQLFDTDEAALEAVQRGEAAAYFGADKTAWDIIDRKSMKNLVVLGASMKEISMYYAFYKGEKGFRDLVNRGLRRIMANGEYDRIYRKWFVPEMTAPRMQALVDAAKKALPQAHTPRSGRQFAAAVLTRSGNVYQGAAVEGARAGVDVSAMELAVSKAVTAGDMEITSAVVVNAEGLALPPSARERELLRSFGRGLLVVLERNKGEYEAWSITRLLPFAEGAPGMPGY